MIPDLLAQWLPSRRWFAGKGRAIRHVAFATQAELLPGAWNTTVEVTFETGPPQFYQVPLRITRSAEGAIAALEDGYLHDGAPDAEVMLALAGVEARTFRPLTVEQSHSSGVYDERIFGKLYRLLTPGMNPDVEVQAGLGECPQIPRLHGWTDTHWQGTSGMLLQEYFPDAVDGWHHRPIDAEALGATTAALHAALRASFPTGSADLQLGERLAAIAREIPAVAELEPALQARISKASGPVPVQRIHGDYHLGQVLHTAAGWKVIDFEGEPGQPRRTLDTPWRDVAGMLRSFDYAGCPADGFLAGYGHLADPYLLTALLIDKAAYEVAYETRNRPDWVGIPLRALRELAST